MNADAARPEHPKNIRLSIEDQYSGPSASKAADHVMTALELLQREGYLMKSYKDLLDHEWLTLTEKGKGIEKLGMMEQPKAILASQSPVVFISCGQYTEEERAVGSRVSELIRNYTNYVPYFAQDQQSFEGLSEGIIAALHKMSGMVVVMHKRGDVATPDGTIQRGSVWIEQEIAIAASLQQRGHSINVRAYAASGIAREGLRQLLQLNPVEFTDNDEVLKHFEQLLRNGEFVLASPEPEAFREAPPDLNVTAEMIGPDESDKRGIYPVSSSTRLVVFLNNAGTGPATDVTVSLEGIMPSIEEQRIGSIGPGQTKPHPILLPNYSFAHNPPGNAPSIITVRYGGHGWKGGTEVLKQIPGSHPPKWQTTSSTRPNPS
jgi:hypothetical protein